VIATAQMVATTTMFNFEFIEVSVASDGELTAPVLRRNAATFASLSPTITIRSCWFLSSNALAFCRRYSREPRLDYELDLLWS
jgi:hypothetical protein